MYRSFSDRVFGGVCGGLAARLPLNAWLLRGLAVLLSVITLGLFTLVYLMLWWILPQESILSPPRGGYTRLIAALILTLVLIGAWYSSLTTGASSPDVLLPVVVLVMSGVLLLRQF